MTWLSLRKHDARRPKSLSSRARWNRYIVPGCRQGLMVGNWEVRSSLSSFSLRSFLSRLISVFKISSRFSMVAKPTMISRSRWPTPCGPTRLAKTISSTRTSTPIFAHWSMTLLTTFSSSLSAIFLNSNLALRSIWRLSLVRLSNFRVANFAAWSFFAFFFALSLSTVSQLSSPSANASINYHLLGMCKLRITKAR
jgi:hypothetical protein